MSDRNKPNAAGDHKFKDQGEEFLTYRRSGKRLNSPQGTPVQAPVDDYTREFDEVPLEPPRCEPSPGRDRIVNPPPVRERIIEREPIYMEKDNSTRNTALWVLVVALVFFIIYLIFLDQKPSDKNSLKIEKTVERLEESTFGIVKELKEVLDDFKVWMEAQQKVKPKIIYKDRVVKEKVYLKSKPKVIYRDRIKWKTRVKYVPSESPLEIELRHRERVLKDMFSTPLQPGQKREICFGEWRDNGCYAPGTDERVKHQIIFKP